MNKALIKAMAELDEDMVIEEVKSLIKSNVPVLEIIRDLQKGIEIVGKNFEQEKYFMSELIISGEIFKEVSQMTREKFPPSTSKYGNFIIGTIYGDIHDIGKNIVATVMRSNGFYVIDLGTDVSTEEFIAAIEQYKPKVIGISCLLTNCFDNLRKCIQSIENKGFRKDLKILIGGGPLDEYVRKYVKADMLCKTIQETTEYCKKLYDMS
ncbi:cobalamin B12-binding domain-containing protein [Clostridium luticellarii]|jgi:methanogenic corrinoid protein MtbC1|uniref:Methionine synthase n=1 Tax=Clostridium luticellarii TaxID=1691940 RepID=A0A2T0B941_9CLOT|nr:cobalamin-dependent protein [Clostridium luticellarii]MCI1946385.1 cobalamin-dependent protein [Clostridium luticellarii]MCI1969629.1 cobalamin-dependent protein [Clostridium luticellarii]MCI1996935.1 cobalamin-dependent protein [Clostridium luticellarii]MCI2041070.1 cobalamin-dependent protein [Clostridium luticellarii]PRR80394.1 Methionine synthase [Clostridium luticellarii]